MIFHIINKKYKSPFFTDNNITLFVKKEIFYIKATGIVRRLDDLGRVVIPKEIRRTMRIRESDPLEIFTSHEGEIILKKYSPIGEMSTFAKQYVASLSQVSGHVAMITDRDQIIAVAGGLKNYLQAYISKELEGKMTNRESVMAAKGERNFISVAKDKENEFVHEAICPIICQGDVIGSVILLSNEIRSRMGEVEQKLLQSAAGFLGRQMEQ